MGTYQHLNILMGCNTYYFFSYNNSAFLPAKRVIILPYSATC